MGTRTALFSRKTPGGVFTIVDYPNHTGSVWFVDSNSTTGEDSAGYGQSPDSPVLTVDYAIGLAAAGDTIYVAEGHNEGSSSVIFDADVAGIKIIGCGVGSRRPTFDYDNAAATIDVGADDITLRNLIFRPSVTAVLIGVDLETDVTGCVIENCEWAIGEDGAGTDEFVKALHLTSGNHDTVMRDLKILAHASAAQATHGIHVDAASDRLTFERVIIDGPYATNGIKEDAAGVNHVVKDCNCDVTGTGYGFHASSTYALKSGNRTASVVDLTPALYVPGLGYRVSKVEDTNAAGDDLFTVTGKVMITCMTGEVTDALHTDGVADYVLSLKTTAEPLCAATTITADAAGTMYSLSGDVGDTLNAGSTPTTRVADINGKGPVHLVVGLAGGTCIISSVHTATGAAGDAITWTLFYLPLEASAAVTAAA